MKKAKIILSAVAVFAVVGGALAFKANRFQPLGNFSSYTTTTAGGAIVVRCAPVPTNYFVTDDVALPLTTYYTTRNAQNICGVATFATHYTTIGE